MAVRASSLSESFSEFLYRYPSYKSTAVIDVLRREEYSHLDKESQVCFDYTGVGLFSSLQRSPNLYGGFGICLSPTSTNLTTHAMYVEGGNTEMFFRNRILRYLNLNEDEYCIVFTANALSAFKLLGCSYPFHEVQNFLTAYDHDCENVEAITDFARMKGAHIQSVGLINPLLRIDEDDLRKKLQGKRKLGTEKIVSRGLFIYPQISRVSGSKNSTQWVSEAQENGWHVLLDATSTDAKFWESLDLAHLSPDFLICSFYYVFGEDPTGFGCLVIKRTVLRTLGDSSRSRAIGMVKIVTKQAFSSSRGEGLGLTSEAINPITHSLREIPGHKRTPSMGVFSFQREMSGSSRSLRQSHSDASTGAFKCVTDNITNQNNNVCGSASTSSNLEAIQDIGQSLKDVAVIKTQNSTVVSSKMGSEMTVGSINGLSSRRPQNSNRDHLNAGSIDVHFTCKGLDYADALGYEGVLTRIRSLSSWLINSLVRLRHAESTGNALVKIYSPLSSLERGPIIAFTLLDYVGNVIDPTRVQMLADRNSISLRTGIIAGVTISDMRNSLEDPLDIGCVDLSNHKWRARGDHAHIVHLPVVYASLNFLNNFSDIYRLWLFISKFLDPDFVDRELWHYQALNQETSQL